MILLLSCPFHEAIKGFHIIGMDPDQMLTNLIGFFLIGADQFDNVRLVPNSPRRQL